MAPMRLLALWLLLVVAALGCAAPSPVIPTPCDPACAPGFQCLAGGCYAPADGGPLDGPQDAPQDAPQGPEGGSDAPTVPDAAPDALPGPPDASDGGVMDTGPPPCDADLMRDPMNCGRCGAACAGGCWRGACQPGVCPLPPRPGAPACATHDDCAACLRASTSPALVPCCNRGACTLTEPSSCR